MLQAVLEPITNREDWVSQCEVRDENDALIDLTGATIVFSAREKNSRQTKLLASTDAGSIVIQGVGVFQFTFSLSQMRGMEASKAYEVGCTIKRNGVTQQFFIGTLPILDGIVP